MSNIEPGASEGGLEDRVPSALETEASARDYYTINGLIKKTGASRETISAWIRTGRLKSYTHGKRYRVRAQDWDEFCALKALERFGNMEDEYTDVLRAINTRRGSSDE